MVNSSFALKRRQPRVGGYNCHFWQPLRLCWANLRSRFPPAFSLPISVLPSLLSSNITLLVLSASGLLFGCSICPCFSYACCLRFGCFVFAFFLCFDCFCCCILFACSLLSLRGQGAAVELTYPQGKVWPDISVISAMFCFTCFICFICFMSYVSVLTIELEGVSILPIGWSISLLYVSILSIGHDGVSILSMGLSISLMY